MLLVHLGAVGALASGAALCGGGGACACSALLHALHPLQLWTVCGLHADRAAAIAAPLHYAAIVSAKKVRYSLKDEFYTEDGQIYESSGFLFSYSLLKSK